MKNFIIAAFLLFFSVGTFAQDDARSLLNKVYQQLEDGVDAYEILKTLESIIEADEKNEKAYLLQAMIYLKLNDFKPAIDTYNRLLQINPRHEEALRNRALVKIQLGDITGAIKDHTLRIQIDPENSTAFFDRAYCKGLLEDIEGSISDYSRAIALKLDYKEALANRGIAKFTLIEAKDIKDVSLSEIEDACEDVSRAVELGDTKALHLLDKHCKVE